jgi:putative ABC transport system permease protein
MNSTPDRSQNAAGRASSGSHERGAGWLEDLGRDVRLGLRSLLRAPAFSIVAVLCLALGIGANAALFSVLNAVLLRPLPYTEPDRLVRIYEKMSTGGQGSVSFLNFQDWQTQGTGFTGLAGYEMASRNLQGSDAPERIRACETMPGLFSILRVPPLLGRTFQGGTDEPGRDAVAVVSEELWRTRFGADPSLVGRTVRLDGLPHTVIGVMPRAFDFPPGGNATDVWLLHQVDEGRQSNRGAHYLSVIGRLKDGTSLEAATAQLVTVAARLEKEYPGQQTGRSVHVQSLQESLVGRVRPTLLILFGAVGLVLLIACANVANLLLARATVRRREVAVRLALGATRGRLVRQFLVESLVLAFAGAASGLLLARWLLAVLAPLAESALPVFREFPLDGRVFTFLLAAAVGSGLLFGIVPALQASRGDVRENLSAGGGKATGTRRQQFVRNTLVVAEIALSLVLLVGAGLLLRGFYTLSGTEPGLVRDNVLTAHLPLPAARIEKSTPRLFRPLLGEVRSLPGVRSAAVISMLPIQNAWTNGGFAVEGRPAPPPGQEPVAETRVASPGFFATLGVPLLHGRDFTERDGENGPDVVIINDTLARKHFPGEDPLGRRLVYGPVPLTIIGVVGDVRQAGLDEVPLAEMYFPYSLEVAAGLLEDAVLVVRTAGPPESLGGPLRGALKKIDPTLPLYDVLTMQEVIDQSLAGRRLNLWLLGFFAAVALVLAATGLYGVISYLVAQRTREIGVRMALGAQKSDVQGLVLRQAAALAGFGILLGLAGALAFTRVLDSLLYGVSSRDPLTFATLAALLAAVALVASWLPARRASRVSPMVAIRAE